MHAMVRSSKTRLAALLTSAVLAIGLTAAPAASGQQQGLVNIEISNVANNNKVSIAIPINAAANICGLQVGVLADMLESGPVDCDARANQRFTVTQ
jgi:hypothetical protein